jgi:predicted nuclease of predicted toxin-antitoxin system
LKFLIDMPITPRTVEHLRHKGHEAVHTSEIGLARAADIEILARALAEDRIVVTADLDYPRLLALQQASGPGVILFRGASYSDVEMLELLDRALAFADAIDLGRAITVIDRGKLRWRRLPTEDPEPHPDTGHR